jgi:uncharacterized membrane protein
LSARLEGDLEQGFPMDIYLLLKTVHLAGAVIFLGNIIVTAWWKVMADLTRNPVIIGFAQRQVTLTDWLFTLGGIILILIGGFGAAAGLALFIASGVIWIAVLIPVQIKAARIARGFAQGGEIPERYWRLQRLWMVFGIIATALPFANIAVMVFKA